MLINPGDKLSPGKLKYAWRFGKFIGCPLSLSNPHYPCGYQYIHTCLKRQEAAAATMCHDCEMGRKVKKSMHGMTVYELQKLTGR